MAQRGGARVPGRGARGPPWSLPLPIPRRNRAADADLAACSLSGHTQAERCARTGDLLQITKALLTGES